LVCRLDLRKNLVDLLLGIGPELGRRLERRAHTLCRADQARGNGGRLFIDRTIPQARGAEYKLDVQRPEIICRDRRLVRRDLAAYGNAVQISQG
jgi:hypothetical protein